MRVAWIEDRSPHPGGAELTSQHYQASAPDDIVLECYSQDDKITRDADLYIIGNCSAFNETLIEVLFKKPIIKVVYDIWPYANSAIREYLLSQAKRFIMVSPLLKKEMLWQPSVPISYVPSAIDTKRFENAMRNSIGRTGVLWLGRMYSSKGIKAALEWSQETQLPVDYYGPGPASRMVGGRYKGEVSQARVPSLMAGYSKFLFLPQEFDACPRVLFEAHYAGCEIVTNQRQGATWWIEHAPNDIENAGKLFWQEALK